MQAADASPSVRLRLVRPRAVLKLANEQGEDCLLYTSPSPRDS